MDLVLCSHVGVKVQLGAMLADHASLVIKVPDAVETRFLPPRLVWQYADADWQAIEIHLKHFDWHILTQGSVDDALVLFVSVLHCLPCHSPAWKVRKANVNSEEMKSGPHRCGIARFRSQNHVMR